MVSNQLKVPFFLEENQNGFLGLFGEKVDAIDYQTAEIDRLSKEIAEERERVKNDPKCIMPAAFFSFKTRWGAAVCAQTQQSRNPTMWLTEWASEPRDVYWNNLAIPYVSLSIRRLIVSVTFFFLTFFFMIPIAIFQSIANIEGIERRAPFLRPIIEASFVKSLIQGVLPGIALKIFLIVLSSILMMMSKVEGFLSISFLERKSAMRYYTFNFINVFLVSVVAGTALEQLDSFLKISANEIQLSSLHTGEPQIPLYFLLGLVYAVVSPIFLPFILVFFALAYVVYRHQIINVYNQEYESAAAFWPAVHGRIIISGLATHGRGTEALLLFKEMLEEGLKPDDVVYVGVLSACRLRGLVQEGMNYFNSMVIEHGIKPTIQHYGCMVDLMGRAGMINEAFELIKNMPMKQNDVIWRSFLSSCKAHQNVELGEIAAGNLFNMNTRNACDYLMLSNIYAQAERWHDVSKIRTEMVRKGLGQVPESSSVEVKKKVYKFVSNDKTHPEFGEIYEMIHQMEWQLKFEGYTPDTSQVLFDVDEEEKRQRLSSHSQKLAIAFSLINTVEGSPIRIVRNVRMCSDCHTYTKLISGIYEREIIVRDRNMFHHFRDGNCSCKDYW